MEDDDILEQEPQVEAEQVEAPEEEEGELVIRIGAEEPEAEEEEEDDEDGSTVVNKLRKVLRKESKASREKDKRIKELEAKLNPAKEEEALPPRPQMADPDIDFDEEVFAERVATWHELKRKHDAKAEEAVTAQKRMEEEWTSKVATYEERKQALKVPDYEDAEAFVFDLFDDTQKGLAIRNSERPEMLLYALAKNPAKAKELAGIKEYDKYIWKLAQMDKELNVTRKAPAPERRIKGSTGGGGSSDATLEKLRKEAERTNDYSKVRAYKKQMKG